MANQREHHNGKESHHRNSSPLIAIGKNERSLSHETHVSGQTAFPFQLGWAKAMLRLPKVPAILVETVPHLKQDTLQLSGRKVVEVLRVEGVELPVPVRERSSDMLRIQ
jgi:hypothetical protein